MSVRVRYAPSPTGLQHIAGARTALYNFLFARRMGGKFVLRIEDTDRKRLVPEALQDIYDTFAWLGFRWDEGPDVGGASGPYLQSERTELYRKHAEILLERDMAYRCWCSPERLEKLRAAQQTGEESGESSIQEENARSTVQGYDRHCRNLSAEERRAAEASGAPSVIRLKIPLEGATSYRDALLGDITVENTAVSPDPVLIKSDGFPTYHMAAGIDDHLMGITHVLRGQDWLPSAPVHVILFRAFGWDPPVYCHLPLVMGKDGHKLSKRLGHTSVREFRDAGYLADALLNCIALVGWSYDGKREIFSLKDLEDLFDLEKLTKSPGVFDYQKLDWFNGVYIRSKTPEELARLIAPFMEKAGLPTADRAMLQGIAELVRERVRTLAEVPAMVRFVFEEPSPAAEDLVPKKGDARTARAALARLSDLLPELDGTDEENETRLRAVADELGMKLGDLLMPLRVAVTGSRVSPPLMASIRVMGVDKARARAARAIRLLDEHTARS